MKLHHESEGPPCGYMEPLLQTTADGSSKGFKRWYTLSHAAKCTRCGNYLDALRQTREHLQATRVEEPGGEVIERIAKGGA